MESAPTELCLHTVGATIGRPLFDVNLIFVGEGFPLPP